MKAATRFAMWLISTATVLVAPRAFAADTAPSRDLFVRARPSLIVIAGPRGGAASGFVVVMGEKKYLITNEHVLRGGYPIVAKLLNGKELPLGELEVADDRDLVRLEVADASVPALALSPDEPNIGDSVAVFGNSEGGGVATSLDGRIVGVGPDLIEVDAPFVAGNSGSPIIDSAGSVLGVATYITRTPDPNDWAKEGTRFTKPRRFAMRISEVKWIRMTQQEYVLRADALADLETFCVDTYDLLYTDKYAHPTYKFEHRYAIAENKSKYRRHQNLCKVLSDVADTYSGFAWKDAEAWYSAKKSREARSARARNDADRQLFMSDSLARSRFEKFKKTYDQIYLQPAGMFGSADWKTTNFKNEASFWFTVLRFMTKQETK